MAAGIYNIIIDQGSDWAEEFTVKDNGVARDLTGYSARAQMRAKSSSTSIVGTFVCTLPDAANGVVKMALGNAASSAIAPGTYDYDLEIYTVGDASVTRLLGGKVTLTPETTK